MHQSVVMHESSRQLQYIWQYIEGVTQGETRAPTRDTSWSQIMWKFVSKIWSEVAHGVWCWFCIVQTIVREDHLHSNLFQFFIIWITQTCVLKRPPKTAYYFSSNLTFSPRQSVGSTWSRRLPVLSARYEYLTVENPSNPSSIRLVWQVSRIGAPFTEKKTETKIAAVNAGCRNKLKARQKKN